MTGSPFAAATLASSFDDDTEVVLVVLVKVAAAVEHDVLSDACDHVLSQAQQQIMEWRRYCLLAQLHDSNSGSEKMYKEGPPLPAPPSQSLAIIVRFMPKR